MQNIFPTNSEVLLLGYDNQTAKIIKILNKKYNITPTLFATNRPGKLFSLFIHYTFWNQELPNNNYYTVHTILDISKSLPSEHRILIPCTSPFQKMAWKYADFFESEYILFDIKDIQELFV